MNNLYKSCVLAAMMSVSSLALACDVRNSCTYGIKGRQKLTIQVDNVKKGYQYACSFVVNGSNADQLTISNINSNPTDIAYNLTNGSVLTETKLVIDASTASTDGYVNFQIYNPRWPWQSDTVTVACMASN